MGESVEEGIVWINGDEKKLNNGRKQSPDIEPHTYGEQNIKTVQ